MVATKPKIISLGEVLWDLFPHGERFGGAPANFACHAAIQGADVCMVSAIGADYHGQEAIKILKGFGIEVSLIQIADAPTGTVGVELNDFGQPTFTIYEHSAWDRLAWTEELGRSISSADAVYFGTLGQRCAVPRKTICQAVKAAEAARLCRVLDINLRAPFFDSGVIRDSVQLASILKLSDEELPVVCSAFKIRQTKDPDSVLRELLDVGNLEQIVLTRGSEGATLVTNEVIINQPGVPTTIVDTVGAGDSFAATFLIGELRGDPKEQTLRKACEVAAATCAHDGAVPLDRSVSIPNGEATTKSHRADQS